jgi:hypothetical protein
MLRLRNDSSQHSDGNAVWNQEKHQDLIQSAREMPEL